MLTVLQEFFTNVLDAAWIIELLIMAVSWTIICGCAKKVWEWIVHSLGMFLMLSIAFALLFVAFGGMNSIFIPTWGYVHGVVSLLYLWIFSPYRKKTWILIWLALYNCILAVAALSGQCSALVGEYIRSGAPEGVTRCLIYLIMLLMAIYLRRFKFDEFPIVPRSGIVLVAIMLICTQIMGWVESRFFTGNEAVLFTLMTVYFCLVLTSIVSTRVIYTMCSEQRDIINLQVERQRYLADREMSHMAESTLEDLRCIRHDLKNQFAYLQILLQEERYDEIKTYFGEMNDHMPPQLLLIECGNHTMNTVLNMEFAKLRARGIEFEHQLVIPPVLPFKDDDLCAIVSNLIDNAMDECVRLKEKGIEDAKIRVEIYPHQSYLYICCKNSTDRESIEFKDGGVKSTKLDKQMHGYGTRIVKKLAEKYNGCADFFIKDEMFVAQVMMDIVGRSVK